MFPVANNNMVLLPQQTPENAQMQFLAEYFMRANYSPRWINGVDVTAQNQFTAGNVRNQGIQYRPMRAYQAHPYHVAPSHRRGIPVTGFAMMPVYFYPKYMYLNTTRSRLFITHQFDTSRTLPTRRCMYRQGESDWHYQVSLTEAENILKQNFTYKPNVNIQDLRRLSAETGLTVHRVQVWFINKRANVNKNVQNACRQFDC